MEEIEQNTTKIATYLNKHPQVSHVYYPDLQNHPDRGIHEQQAAGYGGMISFTVESEEKALEVLRKVVYFTLAESLGAVESLISLPVQITHASLPSDSTLIV